MSVGVLVGVLPTCKEAYVPAAVPKEQEPTPPIGNVCLGDVKNGNLREMSPSNYGYVECDEGFSQQGPSWIYCNADGSSIHNLR